AEGRRSGVHHAHRGGCRGRAGRSGRTRRTRIGRCRPAGPGRGLMPELPEVETVRLGLTEWVVGRKIKSVDVLHPRAVRRHAAGGADFAAALAGRTVTAVRRRGKYLWFALDSG